MPSPPCSPLRVVIPSFDMAEPYLGTGHTAGRSVGRNVGALDDAAGEAGQSNLVGKIGSEASEAQAAGVVAFFRLGDQKGRLGSGQSGCGLWVVVRSLPT